MTHPTSRRNALVDNETAAVNAGTGTGTDVDGTGRTGGAFKFYTGTAPGGQNAATGSLLCIVVLANPSYGAASAAVGTLLGVPLNGNVTASGTIGYARLVDRNGVVVEERTVGTSGAEMNFAGGLAVVSGGTITIQSDTITAPA